MGGTHSTSIVDNAISQTMKNSASILQGATTTQNCRNSANLSNCDINTAADFEIKQICGQHGNIVLNQDAKIKMVTTQELSNALQAQAQAQGVNLSLNPGSTDAESLIKSTINTATKVNAKIQSNATAEDGASNFVRLSNCAVQSKNFYILQEGDQQSLINSVQKGDIGSSASSSIKNTMSASSKAVTKNALMGVLMAVALILGIIVIGIPMGLGSTAIKLVKIILPFVIIVIVLYLDSTCVTKKWPCYKGCLFAPPGGSPPFTVLNNPCCLNNNIDTVEKDDSKPTTTTPTADNTSKPTTTKEYLNNKCLPTYDAGVSPSSCSPSLTDAAKCVSHKEKLDQSCQWGDNEEERGTCKTGYNKTTIIVLSTITSVVLLVGLVLLFKSQGKSQGKSKKKKKK